MATPITPNTQQETANKQWVRANSTTGANSYTGNPIPVANTLTNSGTPVAQLWTLDLKGSEQVTFTSAVTGQSVTLSGASYSDGAALAIGSIVGSGTTVILDSHAGVFLRDTSTSLVFINNVDGFIDVPIDTFSLYSGIVASGSTAFVSYGSNLPANLTGVKYTAIISGTASVVSGTLNTNNSRVATLAVAAATNLNNVAATYTSTSGTGTVSWTLNEAPYIDAQGVTYPSYVGQPYSAPTWVDDATVHAFPVPGFGDTTQDTTKVLQYQVRQIRTGNGPDGGLETEQWDGYFAQYQGNLNQTQQKNTKQQQC